MFKTVSKSLFLLSLFITSSFATTYVVDDDAKCTRYWGKHYCYNTCLSADWSENNFDTIQDAVDAANDSSSSNPDTILICNGTYNESILTKNNANALTIKAVDGQNDVKIISSNNYGIRTNNSTNLSIEGISIEAKNNAIDLRSNAGTFKIKNVNLQSNNARALYAKGSGNDFLIDGVKIASAAQQAIQIENGNSGLIKNSCIGNSNEEGLYVKSSNSLEVTQTCFANVASGKKEALLEDGSNNPYFHENYWQRHDVSGINANDTVLSSCPHSCNSRSEFSGSNLRDFNQIYKKDLYGDIKIFGNTILGAQYKECVAWNRWGYCTEYTTSTACPANDANNAEIDTRYVDVDSDSSTFDSSSSNLALAAGSSIKKAYLYWQGLASADDYPLATKIKLKVPNSSNYIAIQANDSKVNWSQYKNYFPYQATADITEYVKSSGIYTVADLFTTEGQVSGLGTFGAWSIVVVYENKNKTLKNVSVYDGYTVIDENNEQTISLSGFLTPTNGVVNSKFLVFAGEGDVDIFGDYIELDGTTLKRNAQDDGNNAFNASITENGGYVTARNPNCQNNLGIDIHSYDVGTNGQGVIGNDQSSTTIKLGSSQDQYYPSVFAFSTELYIPDVCYEEKYTVDGEVPSQILATDILDMEVYITNKNFEPAKGVSIKKVFGHSNEYERNSTAKFESGSFVSKSDSQGDDIAYYLDDENTLIINLGDGANSISGGDISKDQNETFLYSFSPVNDGNITSYYLVSYRDDSGAGEVEQFNDIPIGKCSDRNITETIIPVEPSGNARIIEKGKSWNYLDGGLFTKIVGLETYYDILYATDEGGSQLTNGTISKVELVNIYNGANEIVDTIINTPFQVHQRYNLSHVFEKAHKKVQFKITLDNGDIATSNDFSVRPASFKGTLPDLWAGDKTFLSAGAVKAIKYATLDASLGYDKNIDISDINLELSDPTKICLQTDKTQIVDAFNISFENGFSSAMSNLDFNDIGDFNVSITDSGWVGNSNDIAENHCIISSKSNTPNSSGKIGCNIYGNISFSIKPYELNITNASFVSSNAQDWLYDANVSEMNVTASVTVQANNKQHQALKNFTDVCYAQDVDLIFYYNVIDPNTGTNVSYIPTSLGTNDHIININKNLTILANTFTIPSASTEYSFNIDRVHNLPLNPIDINLIDVNITSVGVAKEVNNITVEKNKTFYYGRLSTKDVSTNKNTIKHSLEVEVYSTSKVKDFHQNSLSWYVMKDDDIQTISSLNDSNDFVTINDTDLTISNLVYANGVLRFNLNNPNEVKKAFVHVEVPSYLWYSKYNDYNASGDCSQHPCFRYDFIVDTITNSIKSGDFNGTTIGKEYNATKTKKGVKVFR